MRLINQVGFTLEEEETLAAHLLLAGLGNSAIADKSAPKVRARSVTTTLKYIELHPADAVTISEICAATGVSWRTLDRAFMERFGIGPKTYLQRARLSRVREQPVRRENCGFRKLQTTGGFGIWVSLLTTIEQSTESCLRRHWTRIGIDDLALLESAPLIAEAETCQTAFGPIPVI